MQWNGRENAGFTDKGVTPWLKVGKDYETDNVEVIYLCDFNIMSLAILAIPFHFTFYPFQYHSHKLKVDYRGTHSFLSSVIYLLFLNILLFALYIISFFLLIEHV